MCSNCASRSRCFEPSSALRLYWREKPSFAHRIGADRMPHGGQDRGQFVHALRHPQQRAHRIAERGRFEEALQCGHETGISRGDSLAAGAGTPHLTFRQFLAIEIVLAAIDGRTGKPGDPRDHRKPAPAGRSHLARRDTSAARVRRASSRPCPSDSGSHLHRSCHPGYKCSPRSGIPTPRLTPPHARAPRFAYCSGRAYDDGGFSGSSMNRPALAKLLADVRARRVDVIVVYKVDRLTRSLADFAKLVELFDEHDVSFVSVTQAFNTTTSMGRLTLNVLLSFAQFEREVTGERIRDKIAASKKKGIWMGGVVPLGYRVENRALHVVEEHAELVRDLFQRYLETGSVVQLKAILDQQDTRLPTRTDGTGKTTGGGLISRGHLYKILSNPIYVGRLTHKDRVHDGLHDPILDSETWGQVQSLLAEHAQHTNTVRPDSDALLAGKLFDDRGNRMSPSHATKGGRRWRYYVSQAVLQGRKQDAGTIARVPAMEIERRVGEAVRAVLSTSDRQLAIGSQGGQRRTNHPGAPTDFPAPTKAAPSGATEPAVDLRAVVERVMITRTTIEIELGEAMREKIRIAS